MTNHAARFIAVGILATFTATAAANDGGLYGQLQAGIDFFGKPMAGDWAQPEQVNETNYRSWNANVGIGYRWRRWALEANYRYLNGGFMKADLEFDTTWRVVGANHAPVEHVISTWSVSGPSLDVLGYWGNAYLRLGVMVQSLSWTIDVQSLKESEGYPHSIQSLKDTQRRPLIGIGYDFERLRVEATYYDIGGGRGMSAVNEALTLNVGVRF